MPYLFFLFWQASLLYEKERNLSPSELSFTFNGTALTTEIPLFSEEQSHLNIFRQLDEMHTKHGYGNSRLLKMRNYIQFIKDAAPSAVWSCRTGIEENFFKEAWDITIENYTYSLLVTSHKATKSPASTVRNPDTPRTVGIVLKHLQHHIAPAQKEIATRLLSTAFNSHSADCTYTIDTDDQEWSLLMYDNKNHTHAMIDVFMNR